MKGKLNKILLLMLISILLMGCTNGVALGKDSTIDDYIHSIDLESINNYDIEIVLDAENKSYFGKQTITYINNTEETLDELYFHLYPNAYKSLETAPILFDRYSRNPSSYEEGYIDILEVSHSDTSL